MYSFLFFSSIFDDYCSSVLRATPGMCEPDLDFWFARPHLTTVFLVCSLCQHLGLTKFGQPYWIINRLCDSSFAAYSAKIATWKQPFQRLIAQTLVCPSHDVKQQAPINSTLHTGLCLTPHAWTILCSKQTRKNQTPMSVSAACPHHYAPDYHLLVEI